MIAGAIAALLWAICGAQSQHSLPNFDTQVTSASGLAANPVADDWLFRSLYAARPPLVASNLHSCILVERHIGANPSDEADARATVRCWGAGIASGTPIVGNFDEKTVANTDHAFFMAVFATPVFGRYAPLFDLQAGSDYVEYMSAEDAEQDMGMAEAVAVYAVQAAATAVIYRNGESRIFGVNVHGARGTGLRSHPFSNDPLTAKGNPSLVANASDASELFVDFVDGSQHNGLRSTSGTSCVGAITNSGALKTWGDGSFCDVADPRAKSAARVAGIDVIAGAASQNSAQTGASREFMDFQYSLLCAFAPAAPEARCYGSQVGPGALGPETATLQPSEPRVWRMPGDARIAWLSSNSQYGAFCALVEDRSLVCFGRAGDREYPGWAECPGLIANKDGVDTWQYLSEPCVLYNRSTAASSPRLSRRTAGVLMMPALRPLAFWGLFESGEARFQGAPALAVGLDSPALSDGRNWTAFDIALNTSVIQDPRFPEDVAIRAFAAGTDHSCGIFGPRHALGIACWGSADGIALTGTYDMAEHTREPRTMLRRSPTVTSEPYAPWPTVTAVSILRNDEVRGLSLLLRVWITEDWSRGRRYWGYVEDVACDAFTELQAAQLYICTLWPAATRAVARWPAAVSVSWLGQRSGLLHAAYVSRHRFAPMLMSCQGARCSGVVSVDAQSADTPYTPSLYPPFGILTTAAAVSTSPEAESSVFVSVRQHTGFEPGGSVAPLAAELPLEVAAPVTCSFSAIAGSDDPEYKLSCTYTGDASAMPPPSADAFLQIRGSNTSYFLTTLHTSWLSGSSMLVVPSRPAGVSGGLRNGDRLTIFGQGFTPLANASGLTNGGAGRTQLLIGEFDATSGAVRRLTRLDPTISSDELLTVDLPCPFSSGASLLLWASVDNVASNYVQLVYAHAAAYVGTGSLPLLAFPGSVVRVELNMQHAGDLAMDLLAVHVGGYDCSATAEWISPRRVACVVNTSAVGATLQAATEQPVPVLIDIRGQASATVGLWPAGSVLLPRLRVTQPDGDKRSAYTEGQLLAGECSGIGGVPASTNGRSKEPSLFSFALLPASFAVGVNVTAIVADGLAVVLPTEACVLLERPLTDSTDRGLLVVCTVPRVPFAGQYRFALLIDGYKDGAVASENTVHVSPVPTLHASWRCGSADTCTRAYTMPSASADGAFFSLTPMPSLQVETHVGMLQASPPQSANCTLSALSAGGGDAFVVRPGGASVQLLQALGGGLESVPLADLGLGLADGFNSIVTLSAFCVADVNGSLLLAQPAVLSVTLGSPRARWANPAVPDGLLPVRSDIGETPALEAADGFTLALILEECYRLPTQSFDGSPTISCNPQRSPAFATRGVPQAGYGIDIAARSCDSVDTMIAVTGANASMVLASDGLGSVSTILFQHLAVVAAPGACVQLFGLITWIDGTTVDGQREGGADERFTRPTRLSVVDAVILPSNATHEGLIYGLRTESAVGVLLNATGAVASDATISCTLTAFSAQDATAMLITGDAFQAATALRTPMWFSFALQYASADAAVVQGIDSFNITVQCTYAGFTLPTVAVMLPHLRLALFTKTTSSSPTDGATELAAPLWWPLGASRNVVDANNPVFTVSLSGSSADGLAVRPSTLLARLLRVVCLPSVLSVQRVSNPLLPETSLPAFGELRGVAEADILDVRGQAVAAWPTLWLEGEPNLRVVMTYTCTVPAATNPRAEAVVIPVLRVSGFTPALLAIPALSNPAPQRWQLSVGVPFSLRYRIVTVNGSSDDAIAEGPFGADESATAMRPVASGMLSTGSPAVECSVQLIECTARVTLEMAVLSGVVPDLDGNLVIEGTAGMDEGVAAAACQSVLSCTVGSAAAVVHECPLAIYRLSHTVDSSASPAAAFPIRSQDDKLPWTAALCTAVRGVPPADLLQFPTLCELGSMDTTASVMSSSPLSQSVTSVGSDPVEVCWNNVSLLVSDVVPPHVLNLTVTCSPSAGSGEAAGTAVTQSVMPIRVIRSALVWVPAAHGENLEVILVRAGLPLTLTFRLEFSEQLPGLQLSLLGAPVCSVRIDDVNDAEATALSVVASAVSSSWVATAAELLKEDAAITHAVVDVTAVFDGAEGDAAGLLVISCAFGTLVRNGRQGGWSATATGTSPVLRLERLPLRWIAPAQTLVWPSAPTLPLWLPAAAVARVVADGERYKGWLDDVACELGSLTSTASVHGAGDARYSFDVPSASVVLAPVALKAGWNTSVDLSTRCSTPAGAAGQIDSAGGFQTPQVSLVWMSASGSLSASPPFEQAIFAGEPLTFRVALLASGSSGEAVPAPFYQQVMDAAGVRCQASIVPAPRIIAGAMSATASLIQLGHSRAAIAVVFERMAFSAVSPSTSRLSVGCSVGDIPVLTNLFADLIVQGCPRGSRVVGHAADDCAPCPLGTWPLAGNASVCKQCPAPALLCDGSNGVIRVRSGYLAVNRLAAPVAAPIERAPPMASPTQNMSAQLQVNPFDFTFAPCKPSYACVLSLGDEAVVCDVSQGYAGPLCAGCDASSVRMGDQCIACSPPATSIALFMGALSVSAVFAWLLLDPAGCSSIFCRCARSRSVSGVGCRRTGMVTGQAAVLRSSIPCSRAGAYTESSGPVFDGIFVRSVLVTLASHVNALVLMAQLGAVLPQHWSALQFLSIPLAPFGLLALVDLPVAQCLTQWTLFSKLAVVCTAALLVVAATLLGTPETRPTAEHGVHAGCCARVSRRFLHQLRYRVAQCRPLLATSVWPSLCCLAARLWPCTPALEGGVQYMVADVRLPCQPVERAFWALFCVIAMTATGCLQIYATAGPHRGRDARHATCGCGASARRCERAFPSCRIFSLSLVFRPLVLAALIPLAHMNVSTNTAAAFSPACATVLALLCLLLELLLTWPRATAARIYPADRAHRPAPRSSTPLNAIAASASREVRVSTIAMASLSPLWGRPLAQDQTSVSLVPKQMADASRLILLELRFAQASLCSLIVTGALQLMLTADGAARTLQQEQFAPGEGFLDTLPTISQVHTDASPVVWVMYLFQACCACGACGWLYLQIARSDKRSNADLCSQNLPAVSHTGSA